MDVWTEYLRKYARVLWSVGEHQFICTAGNWVCGGAPYGWFLLLCCGGDLVQPWGGSWVEDDSEEVQCC